MAVAFTLTAPAVIVTEWPERAALAPLAGAEKVMLPPFTGSPLVPPTLRDRGWEKAVLTVVFWLLPPVRVKVKPCASKAPMSQRVPCGRLTPRWSVAGQLDGSPVSMAGLPGRSGKTWVLPP